MAATTMILCLVLLLLTPSVGTVSKAPHICGSDSPPAGPWSVDLDGAILHDNEELESDGVIQIFPSSGPISALKVCLESTRVEHVQFHLPQRL